MVNINYEILKGVPFGSPFFIQTIKHKKTVVVQATVLRCSNVGLKLAS